MLLGTVPKKCVVHVFGKCVPVHARLEFIDGISSEHIRMKPWKKVVKNLFQLYVHPKISKHGT